MIKLFTMAGAVLGALGVAAGAFGAHALRAKVEPRMLEVWATGSSYQLTHAVALIACAWVLSQTQSTAAQVAGWAFLIGTLLFSGSLYAMVLSGVRALGAITPIGGVAFIVGWIALAMAAAKL